MEKEFWLERWQRAEIGFHQDEVNPWLARHWSRIAPGPGGKVFVPLCGKSLDMVWLRKQGHSVIGVEISDIAVQAFFRENGCTPNRVARENFERYETDNLQILCGDFFDLKKADLRDVGAVYDRASLVALPPAMRQRYAKHLIDILPRGAQILLIAFDYKQSEMAGPPFAVSAREIRSLYGSHAEIRLLDQRDALAANPQFRQRGLRRLYENAFFLTLNRTPK